MRSLLFAVLLLFTCEAMADAWAALAGSWRGDGVVSAMQSEIELSIRPALEGRGRHLSFRNRMRSDEGKEWLFVAEALYQCDTAGACRGHWYDSRGLVLPLLAQSQADSLMVEWGDASTERGRTTYMLGADGALTIRDEVFGKDGAWREFGTTRATRWH